MKRIDRFQFLKIFGDGKPHSWYEVINLGVRLLKIHQYTFESEIFKKALADGLIIRVDTPETLQYKDTAEQHTSGFLVGPDWTFYDYMITPKGDECLRNEQIARYGDYSYYKNYDRTVHGKYGVDHFAPLPNGYKKVDE